MSQAHDPRPDGARTPNPPGWFDKPENVAKIVKGLLIACALLFLVDILVDMHGYFGFESWPEFAGIFGFLSYSFIVLSARLLRRFVKREEGYYDG